MISYYKNINGIISETNKYESGCWINCIAPDEDEINKLMESFDINPEFLRAALDEEETSHMDNEDGNTLIIIDIPIAKKEGNGITYHTTPLGIIITPNNVITLALRDNTVIAEFADGVVRNVFTNLKTQFVLNIILRAAIKYLQYLKQIDKISDHVEKQLRKSMKNKDLLQLHEIEKSLVYFSASLKANEATLEKILRGRRLKLYEEDQDLLDDVLIEIKQAIEMSNIQMNVLARTMDVFDSIISNNLNVVMKRLTSVSLIISIPTVVSGIYGMNIGDNIKAIPFDNFWVYPCLMALVIMIILTIVLKKLDML